MNQIHEYAARIDYDLWMDMTKVKSLDAGTTSIYAMVNELRKAGELERALKLGHDLLREHPDDRYLKNSLGWVLHDQIKTVVQRARSGNRAGPVLSAPTRPRFEEFSYG